jgi:hypothetical protein
VHAIIIIVIIIIIIISDSEGHAAICLQKKHLGPGWPRVMAFLATHDIY